VFIGFSFFRVFHRQFFRDGLDAAFGDHRHGSRNPDKRVIHHRGRDAHYTAALFLHLHLHGGAHE
jgi:hypothetical protein